MNRPGTARATVTVSNSGSMMNLLANAWDSPSQRQSGAYRAEGVFERWQRIDTGNQEGQTGQPLIQSKSMGCWNANVLFFRCRQIHYPLHDITGQWWSLFSKMSWYWQQNLQKDDIKMALPIEIGLNSDDLASKEGHNGHNFTAWPRRNAVRLRAGGCLPAS